MIINGLIIPEILDNAGKKPWEIKLLDTMDLWKFGDYKNYTSLDLLPLYLVYLLPKMILTAVWLQVFSIMKITFNELYIIVRKMCLQSPVFSCGS